MKKIQKNVPMLYIRIDWINY